MLLELLIVVAIVAILAAIAVPNFIEAQTRAKVARVRSDMRAIAAALEAYRVDLTLYPTMIEPGFTGGVPPLAGSDLKWWYIPDSLSTPIAYISKADRPCPFGGDVARQNDFPDEIWKRYSYENISELAMKAQSYPVLQPKYGEAANPIGRIGEWRILSVGPDRAWNPMVLYDATNGTLSLGNIIRSERHPEGRGSEQQP